LNLRLTHVHDVGVWIEGFGFIDVIRNNTVNLLLIYMDCAGNEESAFHICPKRPLEWFQRLTSDAVSSMCSNVRVKAYYFPMKALDIISFQQVFYVLSLY
jgi:hypothetical protein